MDLHPRTEADFAHTRDALLDAFFEWNADERVVVDVASLLLAGRFALGDWHDLTEWSPELVQAVLLDWVPRAAILGDEYLDAIPRSVAAFVAFLHEELSVAPHAPPAEWQVALERMMPHVRAEIASAEADPSPSRQLIQGMQADGVDLDDEAAVAAWIDAYNERVAALGPSAGVRIPGLDDAPAPVDPTSLRPFDLPPRAELEQAATDAPLMRQLTTFLDWIGDGRPITKTGNLKIADGYELVDLLGTDDLVPLFGLPRPRVQSAAELRDVDWVYTIALEAGWVTTSATRLHVDPDMVPDDPLDRWEQAWLAALTVGSVDHLHGGHRTPVAGHVVDALDEMVVDLLLALHEVGRALPIDGLVDEVLAEAMLEQTVEDAVVLELYEEWVARDVHHLLERLAEVGVLQVQGVSWTEGTYGDEPSGGTARLTGLGAWAVSRVVGATAELSMADVEFEDLLDVIDPSDEEVFSAQLDVWTASHPDAVGDIVEAVRAGPDGGVVELGFAVLHSFGEQAVPQVRDLVDEPQVGALARVFLARHGDEQARATLDVDAPEAMIEVLVSILDVFGPQALADEVDALGPMVEQGAVFERLWRVDHPGAERVLETVGKFHRDKKVAKAARKALFKLRTART